MRAFRDKLLGHRSGTPASQADAPAPAHSTPPDKVDGAGQGAPVRPERLVVEHDSGGGSHTLTLRGSLELDSVSIYEDAVAKLWDSDARSITLDLRDLRFIDSSGLWSITSTHKWCTRESVRFSLIRGPEAVQRVFELTGLSDVLPFVDP